MKNLMIAFAVAFGLCAGASSRAGAQSKAALMEDASSYYSAAAECGQYGLNFATGSNRTYLNNAISAYNYASWCAWQSYQFYAAGNVTDGYIYAAAAYTSSQSGYGDLKQVSCSPNNVGSNSYYRWEWVTWAEGYGGEGDNYNVYKNN